MLKMLERGQEASEQGFYTFRYRAYTEPVKNAVSICFFFVSVLLFLQLNQINSLLFCKFHTVFLNHTFAESVSCVALYAIALLRTEICFAAIFLFAKNVVARAHRAIVHAPNLLFVLRFAFARL